MAIKLSAFACLALALGSASAQIQRASVSSNTTDAFIAQFEQVDAAAMKDWQTMVTREMGEPAGTLEEWVQPANKKNPCKIHMTFDADSADARWWLKPGNRVYWDGDCLDGRAYGIGREFSERNGELTSWLSEYGRDAARPKYYLITAYDRQIVHFKAQQGPMVANLNYALQSSSAGQHIAVSTAILNAAENRIYRQDEAIGGDQVRRAMVLPNKQSYNVVREVNPVQAAYMYTPLNGRGERMGYLVHILDNGNGKQIRHLQVTSQSSNVDVVLPQSYLAHLTGVEAKINSNFSAGERLLQEAYVAINKYKRRVCQGDVRVDFMDNALYGRICLSNGELSVFDATVSKLQEQQKERHAQARARQALQQEQLARQHAAQAQQRRESAAELAQSVNAFATDMNALQQRSSDFTRSYMNANPPPGVQFGLPKSDRTNCMLISNFVHCRGE